MYLITNNKYYIYYFSNQLLCMVSTLANKTAAIYAGPSFSLALPWKSFINWNNKQLQDIA